MHDESLLSIIAIYFWDTIDPLCLRIDISVLKKMGESTWHVEFE